MGICDRQGEEVDEEDQGNVMENEAKNDWQGQTWKLIGIYSSYVVSCKWNYTLCVCVALVQTILFFVRFSMPTTWSILIIHLRVSAPIIPPRVLSSASSSSCRPVTAVTFQQ